MLKSKQIATDVIRTTDRRSGTGSLNDSRNVGGMIRCDSGTNAQTRQKRQIVRLLLSVLFLLSLSTRPVIAGEIKPFTQPDFDKFATEGKPVLLDFRADWCSICAAQAPVIGA